MFRNHYDRHWKLKSLDSPKAAFFRIFKIRNTLEKYLFTVKNVRYRIALSRFRLSNHKLLIETGRHQKPKLERNDRKCFICDDKIEDENHFLIECPLYSTERKKLFAVLNENSRQFISIDLAVNKSIFLLINEDVSVMKNVAKFVFNSMHIRESVKEINDISKCFKSIVILND